MGPVTILDKSAFQCLSAPEYMRFQAHFIENLTITLVEEIVADLTKEFRDGTPADEKVISFARKFGGSGAGPNADYRKLCAMSLLGAIFEMKGFVMTDPEDLVRKPDGSLAIYVPIKPINRLIMSLADGQIGDHHRDFAKRWREAIATANLDLVTKYLARNQIIIPQATTTAEIARAVDAALDHDSLQLEWLKLVLGEIAASPMLVSATFQQWRRAGEPRLSKFAPYAHYCLRARLTLYVADREGMVQRKASNLVDIQYLYYLPFCQVFVSGDKLHHVLASLLMRPDQTLISATDLKASLKALNDFWSARTADEKAQLHDALGAYPPPLSGNIVFELWRKYAVPWNRTMGNLASRLSAEQKEAANRYVEQLYSAAGITINAVPLPVPPPGPRPLIIRDYTATRAALDVQLGHTPAELCLDAAKISIADDGHEG